MYLLLSAIHGQIALAAKPDDCGALPAAAGHRDISTPDIPAPAEELLLQITVNDDDTGEMTPALRIRDAVYLPLARLSEVLEFPIAVDVNARVAQGWFIREQNTLCIADNVAWVQGRREVVPTDRLRFRDGDLYIDSALLRRWLPMTFAIDSRRMLLAISTTEAFPLQSRRLREKTNLRLLHANEAIKTGESKAIDVPFDLAQWPTIDLSAGRSYETGGGSRGTFTALAVGDLGYLTTRLYASMTRSRSSASDLRLSFGRDDREGGLLGNAGATSFRFGDIDSVDMPQAVTAGQARGVRVTNRSLDRADNFELTHLDGDSQPGWQVELYRNSSLIAFQTVGIDGRYVFNAVPVLFGNNRFRLVFYGPQGQVEELTKTVDAAGSLLEAGQFSYNLMVAEKNRTVFDSRNSPGARFSGPVDVLEVEYGLAKWLTLTAGSARNTLLDGMHDYAAAGLRTSVGGVLAAFDHANDTTSSGHSDRVIVSTDLHGTFYSLKAKLASHFENEENSANPNDPMRRQLAFSVEKLLDIPLLGASRTSLSIDRRDYASGRRETLWANQLSSNLNFASTITNTLTADRDNRGSNQLIGTAFLRSYYGNLILGGQVDYAIRPAAGIRQVKLSGLFDMGTAIRNNIAFSSQRGESRTSQIEDSVIFDRGTYQWSVIGRLNDRGSVYVGLVCNLSLSSVPSTRRWIVSGRPLAETGIVAIRPYVDANYDQRREPGEVSPPGISFRIGSQTVAADRSGTAVATQLPVNVPVSIGIESDNQEGDPSWSSGAATYTVVPRAGRVIAVDFPIFETSQVSGSIALPAGARPAGLRVELVDADGQVVRSTRSAFDGYYLLDNIMPGSYTIRVAGANLRQKSPSLLTVTASDFFVRDIELTR